MKEERERVNWLEMKCPMCGAVDWKATGATVTLRSPASCTDSSDWVMVVSPVVCQGCQFVALWSINSDGFTQSKRGELAAHGGRGVVSGRINGQFSSWLGNSSMETGDH